MKFFEYNAQTSQIVNKLKSKLPYIQIFIHKINIFIIYSFAVVPPLIWLIIRYPAFYFPIDISRFFALLAFGCLSANIFITIKRPLKLPYVQLRLLPNIDKLYIHHQILGVLSLLFIYIHYLSILIYYQSSPIIINLLFLGDILSYNLGLISFYILTVGLLTTYLANRIKYKIWIIFHLFLSLFWIFAILHILLVNSNYKNILSLKLIIYLYLFIVTAIYFYRMILSLFLYKHFFIQGKISNIVQLTKEHHLITIKSLKRNGFYNLLPGHYVFLKLAKKHKSILANPFTIVNKQNSDQIQFIIKTSGEITRKLTKSLNEEVYINGPFGILPEEILSKQYNHIEAISAGVGITPIIGMINLIKISRLKPKVKLLYITKSKQSDVLNIYFKNFNKQKMNFNQETIYTSKSGRPQSEIYKKFLPIQKLNDKNLIVITGPNLFTRNLQDIVSSLVKNLKSKPKIYTENVAFNRPILLMKIIVIIIFLTMLNTLIQTIIS